MGMFDTIYCRISLPGIGVVDDAFQSKDTPGQVLDTYEIRADGTLWHQAYDVADRSDPKASGVKRVIGMYAQENLRWERVYLSGCLGFYGEHPEGWVEFEADFQAGTLQGIREVSESDVRTRPRLAIDAITLDQARAEEREACCQIILNRARKANEADDMTLGLALLPLAMKVKQGGGAVPRLRKRLEELEALNAEAFTERDRLDKICREMIDGMKAAEAEWAIEKQALVDDRKATRGMDKETFALLMLLGLSSQDVAAGRVSPLAEALSEIRGVDPIKEEEREYMRRKHQTPLKAEAERLQARVKKLVDEALAETAMDPAQLRQAVIRQLALDLDPSHEPGMGEIQGEVREVRQARAKRKGQ